MVVQNDINIGVGMEQNIYNFLVIDLNGLLFYLQVDITLL